MNRMIKNRTKNHTLFRTNYVIQYLEIVRNILVTTMITSILIVQNKYKRLGANRLNFPDSSCQSKISVANS